MASAVPPPGPGPSWEVVPAPTASRRRAVGLLLAGALAGAVAGPVLKDAFGTPDALKLAAYGAITFATLASVLGSLADRARRVMGRVFLDVDAALEA